MEYTKEALTLVDIHSLRNLAREIGVKSPSSLSKPELINEIIEIKSGRKAPCVLTKKGRPAKVRIEDESFINNAIPQIDVAKLKKQITEELKQELISSILKEIEKKLNELL